MGPLWDRLIQACKKIGGLIFFFYCLQKQLLCAPTPMNNSCLICDLQKEKKTYEKFGEHSCRTLEIGIGHLKFRIWRNKAMEGIQHKIVQANDINIHLAEKGEGPIILFLHGFLEFWYSWRHQIHALASLGYRVVAPDLWGYGDSDAPVDVNSYTYFNVVGDIIGVLDAIGADKVFVVGYDWGALIAWNLCLFRPDRVTCP